MKVGDDVRIKPYARQIGTIESITGDVCWVSFVELAGHHRFKSDRLEVRCFQCYDTPNQCSDCVQNQTRT